jgi:MFS family permease
MTGIFIGAAMLANAVGGPICGFMLDADGLLGLRGWQWVFLSTGIPAILTGAAVPFLLPNGPEQARFYDAGEKAWLRETLEAEAPRGKAGDGSLLAAMLDRRVLLIALMFFCIACSSYGLSYWLPTVVKGFGVSNTVNGLLNVIPWVCVGVALWWVPAHAARTNEYKWHLLIPIAIGASALVLVFFVPGNPLKFTMLCVSAVGIYGGQPIMWLIPSTFLRGAQAAAGLAAINSLANVGGFAAQNAVPWLRDRTGSTLAPMLLLAGVLLIAGGVGFAVHSSVRRSLAANGVRT